MSTFWYREAHSGRQFAFPLFRILIVLYIILPVPSYLKLSILSNERCLIKEKERVLFSTKIKKFEMRPKCREKMSLNFMCQKGLGKNKSRNSGGWEEDDIQIKNAVHDAIIFIAPYPLCKKQHAAQLCAQFEGPLQNPGTRRCFTWL